MRPFLLRSLAIILLSAWTVFFNKAEDDEDDDDDTNDSLLAFATALLAVAQVSQNNDSIWKPSSTKSTTGRPSWAVRLTSSPPESSVRETHHVVSMHASIMSVTSRNFSNIVKGSILRIYEYGSGEEPTSKKGSGGVLQEVRPSSTTVSLA
ncbi:hypothetical protein T439DRAFT_359482 [Meredithblackwellia eburnea MCA 4105]